MLVPAPSCILYFCGRLRERERKLVVVATSKVAVEKETFQTSSLLPASPSFSTRLRIVISPTTLISLYQPTDRISAPLIAPKSSRPLQSRSLRYDSIVRRPTSFSYVYDRSHLLRDEKQARFFPSGKEESSWILFERWPMGNVPNDPRCLFFFFH